jgi:hypothetical protein
MKKITDLGRIEMAAPQVRSAIDAIGLDARTISVEFAARRQLRRSVPGRNELHH